MAIHAADQALVHCDKHSHIPADLGQDSCTDLDAPADHDADHAGLLTSPALTVEQQSGKFHALERLGWLLSYDHTSLAFDGRDELHFNPGARQEGAKCEQ